VNPAIAVWSQAEVIPDQSSDPHIWASRYVDHLGEWLAPFQVDESRRWDGVLYPSVDLAPDGTAIVGWSSGGGGNLDVLARILLP
jgi:hypothetical protein